MRPVDFQSHAAGKVVLTHMGYWAYIPNPIPADIAWSSRLIAALAEAERMLSRLSSWVTLFPFPRILTQPFIRSEAVISSRIEGTQASLADLYTYETAQLSFFEKTDDVREVYNYVRALEYGLERLKTLPVSLRLIRELHGKLMENVRGGTLTPGEFRRSQNWIGPAGSTPASASFVPPPVEEMHKALDELEKFIHRQVEIPALIRIGMVHYQFEAIHPFLDGNGRVGRLLIELLVNEWDLLPQPVLNLSAYIERHRREYYDLLLGVSQKGDWEAWLEFFLIGVQQQSRASVERIDRLQKIRESYQPVVERERNSERMAAVMDYLFSRPILSVRQASTELKMPFKTAQSYLEKLAHAGILREVTGYARNRIFRASEILSILQG